MLTINHATGTILGQRVYDPHRKCGGTVLRHSRSGYPGHSIEYIALSLDDGLLAIRRADELSSNVVPLHVYPPCDTEA